MYTESALSSFTDFHVVLPTDAILEKNLSVLYKGFKVQADIHKIPFSRVTKEVDEAFTLLLPERKKELRASKF